MPGHKSEQITKGNDSPWDVCVRENTAAFCACHLYTPLGADRSFRSWSAGKDLAARRPRRMPDGAPLHRHFGPLLTTKVKSRKYKTSFSSHVVDKTILLIWNDGISALVNPIGKPNRTYVESNYSIPLSKIRYTNGTWNCINLSLKISTKIYQWFK